MRRLVQPGLAEPVRKWLRRHVHRPDAGRKAPGTEGVDGMEGIMLGESPALFHANFDRGTGRRLSQPLRPLARSNTGLGGGGTV